MSLRVSTSRLLQLGLLGAHVQRRADHLAEAGVAASARSSCWPIALATPKSMTLGTGVPSCSVDQDVGGLDVAVDDPLLMGVLHAWQTVTNSSSRSRDRELLLGRSTR